MPQAILRGLCGNLFKWSQSSGISFYAYRRNSHKVAATMTFDRARFVDDLRYLATLNCQWKHQGRTPESGMDCVFSPRWAYERQGLRLPAELEDAFEHYRRPPNGRHMLTVMRKWFKEITQAELEPSDLLVVFNRKNPCHIVVKLSESEFAEAYETDGAISKFLIRPFNPSYRIAACFRIPDFG